jgi:hypothetical protein
MDATQMLAMALDPSLIMEAQGMVPDGWQREFLLCQEGRVLLNCCRQSGKSTTVAALALHTALFTPGSLILILSPTQRQSGEFFRKVKAAYNALNRPLGTLVENQSTLELSNGSRIVALPGKEGTVRSFSGVTLLILDEAAKVPDDLHYTVRPMLPECTAAIRQRWLECKPTEPIFPRIPRSQTLHKDLKRAKIRRLDDEGRTVDFHSLRYFFCTLGARVLPIQVVQRLMHHRDIRETCNLYLDLGLADVHEQVLKLPQALPVAASQPDQEEE